MRGDDLHVLLHRGLTHGRIVEVLARTCATWMGVGLRRRRQSGTHMRLVLPLSRKARAEGVTRRNAMLQRGVLPSGE